MVATKEDNLKLKWYSDCLWLWAEGWEAVQHDQACLECAVNITLLLCYEIDPRETPA